MPACAHPVLTLLNPWEFVRKYRCEACKDVMMCACDEDIASRFLSHQLRWAREYETGDEHEVTLGFQPAICNPCRGLPPVANALAEIHGRTSKFKRYYWRELYFEPRRRFVAWATANGFVVDNWDAFLRGHRVEFDLMQREVTDELRGLHQRNPRYHYEREESQATTIANNHVDVLELQAVHITQINGKGVRLVAGRDQLAPEEFAERHLCGMGYHVIHTESVPFHALFAVLLWPLVQDPADEEVREVFFGERHAAEERRAGRPPMVGALLPSDFGQPPYGHRRSAAIEQYLASLPEETNQLGLEFERLLPGSVSLRQYLWAHRDLDVERARRILEILGARSVLTVLRYLVDRYWERYLGWPDLLAYLPTDYLFVEVKASRDTLREDQKRWIRDNATTLHLPFKLLKIHASGRR